jgi:hypothetical protein
MTLVLVSCLSIGYRNSSSSYSLCSIVLLGRSKDLLDTLGEAIGTRTSKVDGIGSTVYFWVV